MPISEMNLFNELKRNRIGFFFLLWQRILSLDDVLNRRQRFFHPKKKKKKQHRMSKRSASFDLLEALSKLVVQLL